MRAPAFQPSHQASDLPSVSVKDTLVERTIQQGFRRLVFPAQLEQLFMQQAAADRMFFIALCGVAAAVLFVSMLVPDSIMLPDSMRLALVVRVLVFPPLIIGGVVLLYRLPYPALREWGVSAAGCLACILNVALILTSDSRWAMSYVVILNVIVVYANTIARFWPAVVMCVVNAAGHVLVVAIKPDHVGHVAVPSTILMISTIVFTLYYSYYLEHDERLAFLLNLREKGLHTQLKAANLRLAHSAKHDALTHVANRRHFDEYLSQVWAYAQQQSLPVALMLVDVDHFKAYNDRYGHQAGDTCLIELSQALTANYRRPGDLVARWGGEEFAVVMTDASLDTVRTAAERGRMAIMQRGIKHEASSCAPVVTASIGVASIVPNANNSIAELIHLADEALYAAKGRGRNRVWPPLAERAIEASAA